MRIDWGWVWRVYCTLLAAVMFGDFHNIFSNWILCFSGKGVSVLCKGRGRKNLWERGWIGGAEDARVHSRSVCALSVAGEESNKIQNRLVTFFGGSLGTYKTRMKKSWTKQTIKIHKRAFRGWQVP